MESIDDHRVSRLDRSGVRITTGFASSAGASMAVTTTAPERGAVAGPLCGLVMCPSLFTEALRNYRREYLLAQSVAADGIAVQRFQYRGTGNSDESDLHRDTMLADAAVAAEVLRHETGAIRLAFAGARFGALVAASAAAAVPGAPLVLIEPVVDGRAFLDEGLRAKVIATFRSAAGRVTMAQLQAQLAHEGTIDLLGHELGRTLYDSSRGWALQEQLAGTPRPILLLQIGTDAPLRPEYETLVNGWRDEGFDVEVARLGGKQTWWFLHEQIEEGKKIKQKELADADEVAGYVRDWLTRNLAQMARP